MEQKLISGSTATRFELAPVYSGSHAVWGHAEEGRHVLDRVDLTVTEGTGHQRVFLPLTTRFVRAFGAVRTAFRTTHRDRRIGASEDP